MDSATCLDHHVGAIARSARAKEVFVLPEVDAGRREP